MTFLPDPRNRARSQAVWFPSILSNFLEVAALQASSSSSIRLDRTTPTLCPSASLSFSSLCSPLDPSQLPFRNHSYKGGMPSHQSQSVDVETRPRTSGSVSHGLTDLHRTSTNRGQGIANAVQGHGMFTSIPSPMTTALNTSNAHLHHNVSHSDMCSLLTRWLIGGDHLSSISCPLGSVVCSCGGCNNYSNNCNHSSHPSTSANSLSRQPLDPLHLGPSLMSSLSGPSTSSSTSASSSSSPTSTSSSSSSSPCQRWSLSRCCSCFKSTHPRPSIHRPHPPNLSGGNTSPILTPLGIPLRILLLILSCLILFIFLFNLFHIAFLARKPSIGFSDQVVQFFRQRDVDTPCWTRVSRVCLMGEKGITTFSPTASYNKQRTFRMCNEFGTFTLPYTEKPLLTFPYKDDVTCQFFSPFDSSTLETTYHPNLSPTLTLSPAPSARFADQSAKTPRTCVSAAPVYVLPAYQDSGWHAFHFLIPLFTMLRQNGHLPPPSPVSDPSVLSRLEAAIALLPSTAQSPLGSLYQSLRKYTVREDMTESELDTLAYSHSNAPHVVLLPRGPPLQGSETAYFDLLQAILHIDAVPAHIYRHQHQHHSSSSSSPTLSSTHSHSFTLEESPSHHGRSSSSSSSSVSSPPIRSHLAIPLALPTPTSRPRAVLPKRRVSSAMLRCLMAQRARVRQMGDFILGSSSFTLDEKDEVAQDDPLSLPGMSGSSSSPSELTAPSPADPSPFEREPTSSLFRYHPLPSASNDDKSSSTSSSSSLSSSSLSSDAKRVCYRSGYIGMSLYLTGDKRRTEITDEDVVAFADYILLSFLPPSVIHDLISSTPLPRSPSPLRPKSPVLPSPSTAYFPTFMKTAPPPIVRYASSDHSRLPLPRKERPTVLLALREPFRAYGLQEAAPSVRRRLLNWREIVGVIMNEGFDVIVANFDDMSMADQILLANAVTVYLGVHGNNLSNILWSQRRMPVWLLEIMPFGCGDECQPGLNTNPDGNYGAFAKALGINHAVYIVPSIHLSPQSQPDFPSRVYLARQPPSTLAEALAEPPLDLPTAPWSDLGGGFRSRSTVVDPEWVKNALKVIAEDWTIAIKTTSSNHQ